MSQIQALLERRKNIHEGMKVLIDAAEAENRDFNGEEEAEFQKRNGDLDAIQLRIKRLEDVDARNADIEASLQSVVRQPEARHIAPEAGRNAELRKFLTGEGGRSYEVRRDTPITMEEFRTLSKLTNGAGAYTVPTSFYDRLMAHLIEVSGILQAGPTVLNTATGEPLQIPKTTAHSTASLIAEAGTISASDPTFSQVTLGAFKYAILLQVSHELANDTGVDLEGYLAMQAGRAVGNKLGTDLVVGAGTTLPFGVVTNASSGVTGGTGVSGAFTGDNLIDLFYSVIAPYRNSRSCGWLMRDATVATARKLKGTTNDHYLWEPSLQVGSPDTLLGKPLHTDPNVAAVATSAKSVLFGDFSQYFVRLVEGFRFEQSLDYAFNTDLITYRAILRGDGVLVDQTGAIKYFVGGAS